MTVLERLDDMGISLPNPPKSAGSYAPVVVAGDLAFVSGQIPIRDGGVVYSGMVNDSNLEEAQESARLCAVNVLVQLHARIGLERVQRFVRVGGFVNSAPGFARHHTVVDAASDLFRDAFGDRGLHARAAVGVSGLPLNSMTEIEATVRV